MSTERYRVRIDDRAGTAYAMRYVARVWRGCSLVGLGVDRDPCAALRWAVAEVRLRRRCGALRDGV